MSLAEVQFKVTAVCAVSKYREGGEEGASYGVAEREFRKKAVRKIKVAFIRKIGISAVFSAIKLLRRNSYLEERPE